MTIEFEEELPPPVLAWFLQMHAKANPEDNSKLTRIRFAVEGTQYTVWIERQEKELKFAKPWVDPEPHRCTHFILDTDRCILQTGHEGMHSDGRSILQR